MRPAIALLALWLGIFQASPAFALLAPPIEASPSKSVVTPAIETEKAVGSDEAIGRRIRGIFAELPAFADVSLAVSEGVVSLEGTVPEREDIARAEAIAARVQGVVTVENGLQRDLSVNEGLGSLQTLRDRLGQFMQSLPLLAVAALIALAVAALGYLIAGRKTMWAKIAPNVFLADLIASATRFIFVVGGLVIALDMVGASALLGAVLGGAGVVGIALGFAMRDTVENYVASLMLSLRQPFRANDHVVIDNHEGLVIRLTSRATVLMTLDGNHLRIPNSSVFKAVILNYTRNPQRRFGFDLGIDAEDDADAARLLGMETLRGLDFVLANPEPLARVDKVGDSNIVLQFYGWIDQEQTDFYKARSRAIPAVKAALEAAGFALPEPIYRLRFDEPGPAAPDGLRQAPARPGKAGATEKLATAAITAPADSRDIEPETGIARMVDAERASKADARDLLDPKRPVE